MSDNFVGQFYGVHRVERRLDWRSESSALYVVQNLNLRRFELLKRGRSDAGLTAGRLRDLFANEIRILDVLPRDVGPDLLGSNLEIPEILLELVDAPSLETFLAEWTKPDSTALPPETTILEIGLSLVRKLADCHRAGVVFADIRPEHVLVHHRESPPRVTLVDFGLSVLGSAVLAPQEYSPHYAAPEILNGTSVLPASDVYSLGKMFRVLWHVGALRTFPVRGGDAGDLAGATNDVHPSLRTLLRGMTQTTVVRRPTLADVESVLQSCREELSSAVSPLERLEAADRDGVEDHLFFWMRRCDRLGLLTSAWKLRAAEVLLRSASLDISAVNTYLCGCQFSELNNQEQRRYCTVLAQYLDRTQQPSEVWAKYCDLFRWAVQHWPEAEPLWIGLIRGTPAAEREAVARQAKQSHPQSGTLTFLLAKAVLHSGNKTEFFKLGCQAFRLGYRCIQDAIKFYDLSNDFQDTAMQLWIRGLLEQCEPRTADECLDLWMFDQKAASGGHEFQILEQGLALAPRDLRLREAYAEALFRQSKWELVVDTLHGTADSPKLNYLLAISLCRLKKYVEACPILRQLAQLPKAPADVFLSLGHCFSELGERVDALNTYRDGSQRFPEDKRLQGSLKTLQNREC